MFDVGACADVTTFRIQVQSSQSCATETPSSRRHNLESPCSPCLRGSSRPSRLVFAFCVWHLAFCIATSVQAQSLVPDGARQLVMPFDNETRDARYEWLAEGAASALTDDLVALGAQALSREDRLRAFEHLRVPASNKLSEATVIRIAQIVGAQQIVVGSFALNGTSLTVHARPIRLDTGRRFSEIAETGPLTDLFVVV